MRTDFIKAYCSVMKYQSVTKAAEMMGTSQPAVSKMLAQFEHLMGFKLFQNIKGRLYPTPEGKQFYKYAERALSGIEQLHISAGKIKNNETNHLKIHAMPALSNGFLVQVIAKFNQQYPHISTSLVVEPSTAIIESVRAGNCDLGLAMKAPPSEQYTNEVVNVKRVCILPVGHELTKLKKLEFKDLGDYPLIYVGLETGSEVYTASIFETFDTPPNIICETTISSVGCHFVKNGLGCCIIDPFSALSNLNLGFVIKRLKEEILFSFSILVSKNLPVSQTTHLFIEYLREEISQIESELDKY